MTGDEKIEAWRLILAALVGVRVIVCPRCHGLGEVGLPTLRAICPQCRGCGETTNGININEEVPR